MKTFYIALVYVLLSNIALAQTFTGQVTDSENNSLSFANVVAKTTENNSIITGKLTDENGQFSLQVETKDSFYIEFSFVGYETKRIEPTEENLGKIQLSAENSLEEVVVIAQQQAIEQQADRLVFNVENSPIVNGGDAMDALKATPSVAVANDQISILGKGVVKVMINDKLVQLQGDELIAYLESISADDVQKIEVITTPPSKYDAEGNAGLINIQLKQPKEGSWNNTVRANYIQTTYPGLSYGNTFNYNNGKLSTMISINGKEGYEGQVLTTNVAYPTGPWIGETVFKEDQNNLNGRIGIDYQLGENTTIGGLYSRGHRDQTDIDWGYNTIFNTDNEKIGRVNTVGTTATKTTNQSANVHLIQKIDTLGRKLSLDADYFLFERPIDRVFSSEQIDYNPSLLKVNNVSGQKINNKSLKVDMEHPFQKIQFNYGAKFSTTMTDSHVNFFNTTSGEHILDRNQSNEFDYEEKVLATYADASKQLGKNWQAKAGLRVEKTKTTGTSKTVNKTTVNEYTKLFPTFYLSNKIDENNSANFSYSKRISRPGFWELNPFRWYINQNSYAEGNPFLQPAISNNFELQHTYKGSLISKAFYSATNQSSGEVSTVNPQENQIFIRRENFYNGTKYGLEETLVFAPTNRWNTTTQISVYNTQGKLRDGFSAIELNTGWAYSIYSNNSFALAEKHSLKAEITGVYASPQPIYMFKTSSIVKVDWGLRAKFIDDKLSVNTSVKDIFKTSAPDVFATSNGIDQQFNNYNDNRFIKIGVNYRFGNQKIRVKQRKFGNEDEQGRSR